MSQPEITPVLNVHCQLGENPLWNPADACLYWEDIDGGRVHRLHPASGEHKVLYEGATVGGFTFQTNDDLLLFRERDLALLHPDGSVEVLQEYTDEGLARFNDVIADPEGRVYAGSIGRTDESGGLYRVDRDGTITLLWRGTGCSNGMGFSPDLKTFYWTCSTRKKIFRYPYDRATGELGPEETVYSANDTEGITDGLTVDRDGHLWSARWDGHAVIHHGPDGKVLDRIEFPVAKVTSLCFGGPNLDEFYVTTAGGSPGSDTLDGAVFHFRPGTGGPAEFMSGIGL